MPPIASTRRLSLLAAALAVSVAVAPAFAGPQEDARAQNAVRVLVDMQAIPESAMRHGGGSPPYRWCSPAHSCMWRSPGKPRGCPVGPSASMTGTPIQS